MDYNGYTFPGEEQYLDFLERYVRKGGCFNYDACIFDGDFECHVVDQPQSAERDKHNLRRTRIFILDRDLTREERELCQFTNFNNNSNYFHNNSYYFKPNTPADVHYKPPINAVLVAKLADRGVDMDWQKVLMPETIPKMEIMLGTLYQYKKPWKWIGHEPDYREFTQFVLDNSGYEQLRRIIYDTHRDIFNIRIETEAFKLFRRKTRQRMQAEYCYFTNAVYRKARDFLLLKYKIANFTPLSTDEPSAQPFNGKAKKNPTEYLDDEYKLALGALVLMGQSSAQIKIFQGKMKLGFNHFNQVRVLAYEHGERMMIDAKSATSLDKRSKNKKLGIF